MENNLNLDDIQAVVGDMDGVLWYGLVPAPGLVELVDAWQHAS
jgi:hypothetical protein